MQRPSVGSRPRQLEDWLTGTNLAFLANRLATYFIPTSAASAIGATASSTSTLQDAATIPLAAGALNWSFKTAFNIPPSVTATPQKTTGSTSTGTMQIDSVTKTGCVVKSSDSGDTRLVHLQAVQPSQGD